MADHSFTFGYRVADDDELDLIQPLWEKLRAYHSHFLSRFPGEEPPYQFNPRKQEILAKAAAGKLRIEVVDVAGEAAPIAYCVSTVSKEGRGEVDSIFVEARFRGRGVGSELLRRALSWFEATGASSRVVNVAFGNAQAVALYSRFGFHPRFVLLQQTTP